MTDDPVGPLVAAAMAGDQQAWNDLVTRFAGLVTSVAREHGLSPADVADVSQTTWLRLAEHLERIRDRDRVGLWLATTARHESLRALRRAQRQVPMEQVEVSTPDDVEGVDRRLLDEERDEVLWRAFEALPPPCKVLLRTLMADPRPSYAEVAAALGMPVGSIGPRRNRCIDRLRRRARTTVPAAANAARVRTRRAV